MPFVPAAPADAFARRSPLPQMSVSRPVKNHRHHPYLTIHIPCRPASFRYLAYMWQISRVPMY